MQKYICLIALLFAGSAYGQALWEIENTSNQIRLLGSIHFLRAEDYPLPPTIEVAYNDAEIIVMEIDLTRIKPDDITKAQQELAIDPRGRNLKDLLGAAVYQKAKAQALQMNIDLDMLLPFEPWFAALQITQIRLMQLGFDGSYGIESQITNAATSDSKPIMGLETLREQLSIMDSLPAAAQKKFLLQTLDDIIDIDDELDDIVIAWKTGNIKVLDKLLLEGLADQPEVYQKILVERNQRWTTAIKKMTNDSKDYLIVVGALHLIGEDSVQEILKSAGVKSRQIR